MLPEVNVSQQYEENYHRDHENAIKKTPKITPDFTIYVSKNRHRLDNL